MRIVVVLVDRANYGRLKPVMVELKKIPEVEMKVVCAGTMMLDRFGNASQVVQSDGFEISDSIYLEVEGSVPETMSKSVGLGVISFAMAFNRLKPDFVLLIGDRYEALSAAIAAAYNNHCLIHLQGGEVTGSIDESARHAITKFSHYHFPATKISGQILQSMGERPDTVFSLGCPSVDVVTNSPTEIPQHIMLERGVGRPFDASKPYVLVLFHPVTTEFQSAEHQMEELMHAVNEIGMQAVVLWPNVDAGADGVSQAIRRFREHHPDARMHFYKNFEPEVYIPVLATASCAVGNSSSFVRDASFLGTPVVLVGSRQDGRERAESVVRVEATKTDILTAIHKQLKHGKYPASSLYGLPGVSKKIASQISKLKPYLQKKLVHNFH